MQDFVSLLHVLAAVLAAAGAAKVIRPAATSRALAASGLPSSPALVRVLGACEVIAGVAAIVLGGWVAPAVVAVFYAAFAGFVASRLRSGDRTACGCFGESGAPLTAGHLVFDATAAVLVLGFVLDPVDGLATVLSSQPWAGVPYILATGVGVGLCAALLTVLPATRAARFGPTAPALRFEGARP